MIADFKLRLDYAIAIRAIDIAARYVEECKSEIASANPKSLLGIARKYRHRLSAQTWSTLDPHDAYPSFNEFDGDLYKMERWAAWCEHKAYEQELKQLVLMAADGVVLQ